MGIVAIATYRPKPGREHDFLRLLQAHIPTLREGGRNQTVEALRDPFRDEFSRPKHLAGHAPIDRGVS
jgi:hypothetical protein